MLRIAYPNAARNIAWGFLACAVSMALPLASATASPITKEEAHSIGVEAYVYLYPLVTMDITRKQMTNVAPGKELGRGPMNTFVNVRQYPLANFRDVVRPNFDTLYSIAWVDLTKEPQVISVPDTHGRYYLLPMLDMWTDVFASPGWRTTGTQAANFQLTPPGWRQGETAVPNGVQRVNAPTPYVWIIGRTKTDGPADYDAVHKIQAGYKITPLSQWGKAPVAVRTEIEGGVDMKTPPKLQVQAMTAGQFFAYAAQILKLQPPHLTDEAIIARMKRIGLDRGKNFDIAKLDPSVREGLAGGAGRCAQTHAMEDGDIGSRRERLVDEY